MCLPLGNDAAGQVRGGEDYRFEFAALAIEVEAVAFGCLPECGEPIFVQGDAQPLRVESVGGYGDDSDIEAMFDE